MHKMEDIIAFTTYNTDWLGEGGLPRGRASFNEVLAEAITLRAKVIVKTSAETWYIKVAKDKTYDYIQRTLEINVTDNFRTASRTWLLWYRNPRCR